MQPLVSIVIPVYNGEDYLAQAIDSALNQTYKNIEIIVVDDGSIDSTWEIIQSYGTNLIPIRKENGGTASALNAAIRQARGDYIAWLSHDDMFLPNKIERQIEFFKNNPNVYFCYGNYTVTDEKGFKLHDKKSPCFNGYKARRQLLISSYIHGCTTLIHRKCFETVGLFTEELPHTQDTDMWLRISEHFDLGYIDEILILSRRHGAQGSRSYYQHIINTINFYNYFLEHYDIIHFFPPNHRFPNESNRLSAYKYSWLADIILCHRYWFEFATILYKLSLDRWYSIKNPAWFKIKIAKLLLQMHGSELDYMPYLHEAIMLSKLGKKIEAMNVVKRILLHKPLNIISLLFLIQNQSNIIKYN